MAHGWDDVLINARSKPPLRITRRGWIALILTVITVGFTVHFATDNTPEPLQPCITYLCKVEREMNKEAP